MVKPYVFLMHGQNNGAPSSKVRTTETHSNSFLPNPSIRSSSLPTSNSKNTRLVEVVISNGGDWQIHIMVAVMDLRSTGSYGPFHRDYKGLVVQDSRKREDGLRHRCRRGLINSDHYRSAQWSGKSRTTWSKFLKLE